MRQGEGATARSARGLDRRSGGPVRPALAGSLLLHLAILTGIAMVPWSKPAELVIPIVKLVFQGNGGAGAAGGKPAGEKSVASEDAISRETAPEAALVPKPRPKPVRPPHRRRVTEAAANRAPERRHERQAAAPLPSVSAPPNDAAGAGAASASGSGTEGAGQGALGSGAGPGDDYMERLRRWLSKYKRYPHEAEQRKQEGRVVVGFTVTRDGTLLDPRIETSSGIVALDEASLAMLRAASPVPPLPARYNRDRIAVVMPVDFTIGFFERLF